VGLCCYESRMRPYEVFLAALLPTLIAASCQLYSRHYCRLDLSSHRKTCGVIADLIFIIVASILPLPHFCGIMLFVQHCYFLAFIVLTYLTYLIAVNTSYRSSLGTTDPGIQAPRCIRLGYLEKVRKAHFLLLLISRISYHSIVPI
jgi:hypothetical protein